MLSCYLPDIGDGLAAGIKLLDGSDLQIDCGSKQNPKQVFRKSICRINPDVFILSHFHLDHYNGFFYNQKCRPHQHPTIQKVFFPKLPRKKEIKDFILCMFAINIRFLGDISGSMELDFLNLLSKRNKCSFAYKAVSQGDIISLGGSHIEILWPPKEIDESALKIIKKAIDDFEEAKKEDKVLNDIYNRINQDKSIEKYFQATDGENIYSNVENRDDSDINYIECRNLDIIRSIPEQTKKANKSLKHAANHLSLAFRYNNQILFLGDLESSELRQISNYLSVSNLTHYLIIITPHHGTHWHNALSQLSTIYAISSVGPNLFPKIKPEFKQISDICLYTYANGDIEIPHPILRPLRYWRGRYWRLYI